MDSREDEQQRGITMKSSSIRLTFKTVCHLKDVKPPTETEPTTRPSKTSISTGIPSTEAMSSTGISSTEAMSAGLSTGIPSTEAITAGLSTKITTEYVINLIDSPGHIDFSSEVSTASKLADGALILIDTVEGVCTQTITVLKQAYADNVKPILVLNKIDRLIVELAMSPDEAYLRLRKVLEQVNVIMAMLFRGTQMQEDAKGYNEATFEEKDWTLEDKDDSHIYFSPLQNNVIFCSSIDGWAFTTHHFASIYAQKLGINELILQKTLWGEYYLDSKTKRIITPKNLKGRFLKPLFVQLILENVFSVYDSILLHPNPEKVEKIVKALDVKISPREMNGKDKNTVLKTVMGQWLPLSRCVLMSVVNVLPSPITSQPIRFPKLFDQIAESSQDSYTIPNSVTSALMKCDAHDEIVIGFIAKMFSIPKSELPINKRVQLTAEELRALRIRKKSEPVETEQKLGNETVLTQEQQSNVQEKCPEVAESTEALIGFARLYSGTLRIGSVIHILGPKYSPLNPHQHSTPFTITSLYTLMGRDLLPLTYASAGMVFGIGGLEDVVLKYATFSTTLSCPSLCAVNAFGAPLVRVAVEPLNPHHMPSLISALKLLNQSDPCVEVYVQETGEHVIVVAGELHLERCLKDIERFGGGEVCVSEPIVGFRESIVREEAFVGTKGSVVVLGIQADEVTRPEGQVHAQIGCVVVNMPNKMCTLKIRAVPLPSAIVAFLNGRVSVLKKLDDGTLSGSERDAFWNAFEKLCTTKEVKEDSLGVDWNKIIHQIISFGPKRVGANLLCWDMLHLQAEMLFSAGVEKFGNIFETSLITGFQLATASGPLCAEPMSGVCFLVKDIQLQDKLENTNTSLLSGQIISTMREACKLSFMKWSSRLLLATYICDLQAPSEVLGKVYAVIAKRKGRILSEEMQDGTPFFNIKSSIPVIESFGFADEIRKRTSGAASPQFVFGGYEVLDVDPFWTPTTEEELDLLGDKSDKENLAKKYMEKVRKRKGLAVDRVMIEHAEKQKTLKTNK